MYDFLINLLQSPTIFALFVICFVLGFIVYVVLIAICIFGGGINVHVNNPTRLKHITSEFINTFKNRGVHK